MKREPGTPPFGKKRLHRRWGRSGSTVLSGGVEARSKYRVSPSRVRTLECPLDLATRRLLLALARVVGVAANYMAQS